MSPAKSCCGCKHLESARRKSEKRWRNKEQESKCRRSRVLFEVVRRETRIASERRNNTFESRMANNISLSRISLTVKPIDRSTSTYGSTDGRCLEAILALFGCGPNLKGLVFTINTSLYDSVTEGVDGWVEASCWNTMPPGPKHRQRFLVHSRHSH